MRFSVRLIAVAALLLVGWVVSRCGDVTVSDLNPDDFVAPSPTASPTP
jgi:hypothetical protein